MCIRDSPYRVDYNEEVEADVTSVVTVNIFVSAMFEFAWCLLSVKVSFLGLRTREYSLRSDPKIAANHMHRIVTSSSGSPPDSSHQLATYGSRSSPETSSSGEERRQRREFVLNSSPLPPGYSADGILADPDFICHLTDVQSNQFHIARANPLCSSELGVGALPSGGTMSREDKVKRFLNNAVQTAEETSRRLLQMNPTHTYRSAVA